MAEGDSLEVEGADVGALHRVVVGDTHNSVDTSHRSSLVAAGDGGSDFLPCTSRPVVR